MKRIRRFLLLVLIYLTGIRFRPVDKKIETSPYRRLAVETDNTIIWFNFHKSEETALKYMFGYNRVLSEDIVVVNAGVTGVNRDLFPDLGDLALTMRTNFLFRASDRILSILLLESFLEYIHSVKKKN